MQKKEQKIKPENYSMPQVFCNNRQGGFRIDFR